MSGGVKNAAAILLAVLLCVLAGCTGPTETGSEIPSEPQSEEVTGEVTDKTENPTEFVRVPLRRGMNLTCWEMGEWRPREYLLEEKYYREIAGKGFDHVRIPVNFSLYSASDGENPIPAEFLGKLDTAITLAMNNGLYVILDMHGCGELNREADRYKSLLYAQWRQLAEHYREYGDHLLFELLNEPNGGDKTANCPLTNGRLNEIENELIREIREIDPDRVLIAAVSQTNMVYEMYDVTLPQDDPNIIVAFHSYEPMEFTHQGATWSSQIDDKVPCSWKSEYEETVADVVRRMAEYSQTTGRQVWLGEFGVCLDIADHGDVTRYLTFMTDACKEQGIGWCYWEFWMSFGAFDRNAECWRDYVLDGLIH